MAQARRGSVGLSGNPRLVLGRPGHRQVIRCVEHGSAHALLATTHRRDGDGLSCPSDCRHGRFKFGAFRQTPEMSTSIEITAVAIRSCSRCFSIALPTFDRLTNEGAVRCAVSQTQVRGENRRRVPAAQLITIKGGDGVTGVVVLPFGLRLDAGVLVAVDDNTPMSALRFSTCLPQGCLVPLAFDAAAVTALKAGAALNIRATANDGGQDVAFSISLSGFTSALDRLGELDGS